jgi:hypothetical protein
VLKDFSYHDPKVGFGQDSHIKNDLFHALRLYAIISLTHMRRIVEMYEKDDF